MTRPQIIRADTIDLQDPGSPSAKDHSRQPTNPAPLGEGPPAPHQAIALKNAGLDGLELHARSPRASQDLSNKELQLLHEHSEDEDGITAEHTLVGSQRNSDSSTVNGHDGEDDDDMDDGMDDDMMDKISSSPSIVDGGSSRACVGRDDSPTSSQHPRTPPRQFSRAEEFSSSPYVQTPDRLPISFVQPARDQSDIHHQIGEYQDGHAEPDHWDGYSSEERDQLTPLPSDRYCHVPESPESRADVEDAYVEGEYEGSSTDGDHSEDQAPSLSARLTDVQEEFENEEAFFTPAESPSGFFQEDQDNEDSLGEDYADEERDQLTPLPSERLSYFREEFETAEEEDEPEEEPNIVVHRPRLFNLGRFSRRPLPPLPSLPLLGPLPIPSLPFLRYTPPQPTDSPMDDRIRTAAVDRPTRPSYPEDPGGEDSYFYGRPNEYHSDAGDESAEESDDDADYFTFIRKRIANAALTEYDYLHRLEDIDFEFVYALHTFVATVEGQANATKGDTMVLLDDSNSYWWLVRVVKDSSIGYLPAEHIETPTERLARLNKHRNIDLSQTMLGDNPEKSRNPLKKAMRRRNAKTVTFTDPTYYEPSDHEYSSEEDENDEPEFLTVADVAREDDTTEQAQNDSAVVEPLKVRSQKDNQAAAENVAGNGAQQNEIPDDVQTRARSSSDISDPADETATKTGRKMRNTDSFYKDDSIETRKINLTPSLLRDDSSSAVTNGSSIDSRTRGSFDTIEKSISAEKNKEEKRKDKKPGMLSGLFKRKDRKSKTQSDDDDPDWLQKEIAANNRSSPQPKMSSESVATSISTDMTNSTPSSPPKQAGPQRQSSKLQKNPPMRALSNSKKSAIQEEPREVASSAPVLEPSSRAPVNPFDEEEMYGVDETDTLQDKPSLRITTQNQQVEPSRQKSNSKHSPVSPADSRSRNVFSPIRDALHHKPSNASETGGGIQKVKKVKNRMALDSSDSSPDTTPQHSSEQLRVRTAPSPSGREPAGTGANGQHKDRLSESPIQVSPMASHSNAHSAGNPPPLMGDSSSQDDIDGPSALSPVSPSSTPELIERPTEPEHDIDADTNTPVSTTQSSREWSESALRSYLESDQNDIRDLLVVVHDTSDVKPPGPEHPTVKGFDSDRRRLTGMESRLDGLLSDLLARRRGAGGR